MWVLRYHVVKPIKSSKEKNRYFFFFSSFFANVAFSYPNICLRLGVLHLIDVTILFFRKSWLHVATTGGTYEIRVEPADNGLTDLKRGIERAPRNS